MNPQLIDFVQGNPLDQQADVLIHPTCGVEAPAGERFEKFFERTGTQVLETVQSEQPLRIGEAIASAGGELNVDQIVHVPVRTGPGVPTTVENIQVAYRTALVKADQDPSRSVTIPAPVGPEELEVTLDEVTSILWQDFIQYPPVSLNSLVIADSDPRWIESFRRQRAGSQ